MQVLSFLKVGLLAMLERLDLVPKEVSDRAAIEYVQKYGIPQPAPDDGFDDEQFHHKRSHRLFKPYPAETVPDLNNPGKNVIGSELKSFMGP